ncbi:family 10 glycosylhydrolase [Phormidium yuhuli AB48]|uniref:Family 10 glycosylhydrolase n=1 Tax=Phormidium yuhuli AB48 TaxID=2940671 RepID=A0ABY5ASJ5_9CYAN|nr:glycoside hydrolase family 10 protein [Phormidium yuhuli]USR92207.1 family 10 glycosylhydrolase [Phormidium yuhuli AB48]
MTNSVVCTHQEMGRSLSSSWGWLMGLVSLILPSGVMAQESPAWVEPCLQELRQQYSLAVPGGGLNQPVTRGELSQLLHQIKTSSTPLGENLPRFTEHQGTEFYTVDPHRHVSRWQLWETLTEEFGYQAANPPRETLRRYYRDGILVQDDTALEAIAAAAERGLVVNPSGADWLYPYRLASRADVVASLCQVLALDQPEFMALVPGEFVAPIEVPELRGVWLTNVDSEVLFSSQALQESFERLHRLNFNTVYPVVWNWGYTLYPSEVAEPVIGRAVDPEPGLQERDMLAEAVEYGQELGLRVIPWFEFGFQAPSYSELARRNPEWLTQRADGTQTIMEGEHERVWLNPFHPEVQEFILDLVLEIVENYDVDGIQFDDHFGLPVEFGYDDYTVELYRREHDGEDPPEDFNDPDWVRWRADKITEFMGRTFEAVKAVNPQAVVSVSPNPQHFAYARYLQDWQRWQELGYMEELVLQVYRSDIEVFIGELNRPEVLAARREIPVAIAVLAGLRNRPTEMPLIEEKVRTIRNQGFAGMSFFFYQSLWDWSEESPAQREAGLAGFFREAIVAPDVMN